MNDHELVIRQMDKIGEQAKRIKELESQYKACAKCSNNRLAGWAGWTPICPYCRITELKNMLEDVVNELDLSSLAIEQHGPLGTPPAELVRLVLTEKDLRISALNANMHGVDV